MEKEAFTRCMLDILNVMDLAIYVVSTDRHVSIKKLMKTDQDFGTYFISETLSEDDTRRKEWLQMGSESHEKLRKILCEKTLLTDLENMTEQIDTTMLEVFHALKIAYLAKKTFFGIEKMFSGTQIAALDHNHNVNREQVQTTIIFFAPEFLLSVST